jgi:F-type H+-transporting ATPase subunit epsilon
VSLELTIVTPGGQAYTGDVDSVVLPGAEGDFGVLERHERYLAPLRPGAVEIKTGSGSEWAAVSDGFADVSAEQVVVLVDRCRRAADIDRDASQSDLTDAQAELAALSGSDEDQARKPGLEALVARAELELEIAGRG